MATAGLSLVGFMANPAQALHHLSNPCIPANPDPAVLLAEWQAAQAQLGAPIPNAGNPNILGIPQPQQSHIAQLQAALHWQETFASPDFAGFQFQLVEIEQLLAYQQIVDVDRSAATCAHLSHPPTMDELMNLCLPINAPQETVQAVPSQNALLVRSRSLNVRVLKDGKLSPTANAFGVVFGIAAPFAHVVRFNGRCYLHNGYHRTYGARLRGATHIPCVFRDVTTAEAAGVRADGSTFDIALLESNNPPTLAHFTQPGRAKSVQVRQLSRTIHVTWYDYVTAEE